MMRIGNIYLIFSSRRGENANAAGEPDDEFLLTVFFHSIGTNRPGELLLGRRGGLQKD